MSVEVRCKEHGTFVYKSAECPGCKRTGQPYEARKEAERARLRALRENEEVRGKLFLLERKHGIEHTLGRLGQTYEGFVLGAVDIAGKRYVRLHRKALNEVTCVPWIDAFAEWIGERVAVEWRESEHEANRFRVSERDGVLPEAEEEELKPIPTLRERLAAEARERRGGARNPV